MSGFLDDLEALCWDDYALSWATGVRRSEVKRWIDGRRPAPASLVAWLAGLAEYMRDHPPPPAPARPSVYATEEET